MLTFAISVLNSGFNAPFEQTEPLYVPEGWVGGHSPNHLNK